MNVMKSIFVLAFFSLVLAFSLSCERENPEYPFTITVKTYDDSIRVANVLVKVEAPVPGNTAYFEGYTDERGQVHFIYDRDAVLDVRATRGDINAPSFSGCSTVRLEADTQVEQTVYIQTGDLEDRKC